MNKFELGQLVITRAVADQMQVDKKFAKFIQTSLGRYIKCDRGDTYEEDQALNNYAVKSGEDRIHAGYIYKKTGRKIWIITEWNHSVTTILFREDY